MSARDTLDALLKERGAALLSSPRLLENLLRDLLPEAPLEVAVLVEAVDAGVVEDIRRTPPLTPWSEADIIGLADRLEESSGLNRRAAIWCVESWLQALERPRGSRRRQRTRRWIASERAGTLGELLGDPG